jgi:hypothetical protein
VFLRIIHGFEIAKSEMRSTVGTQITREQSSSYMSLLDSKVGLVQNIEILKI